MHSVAFTLSIIQPQDIFCHIERLSASADLGICLITVFFFSVWNKRWWKAAILLFTLESVLLSRLLLNSVMARSSIHICCLFFFHPPTLCLSSLSLSSSLKGTVCHFCLMCGEWIKQSVTSTRESTNVHMAMENKIWASMWITLLTNTSRA